MAGRRPDPVAINGAMRVFDRRVVLVTGKGGVGKTVVASALALAAARSGRRVVLCETAGSTRAAALFGHGANTYTPTPLAPNLWGLSITPERAIEEYLIRTLRFRKLYEMVFRNRVVGPFMDAVPGLHDLIQLGKAWDLERATGRSGPEWDLIVVDAPATGHGLTMLASPRAMMELTRVGPFYENSKNIAELFEDPTRCAAVLVSLPEELPVNETLDLWARLEGLQSLVAGVVLNEVHPAPSIDRGAWDGLRGPLSAPPQGDARAVRWVDAAWRRLDLQARARARLDAVPRPLLELPFLFRRELGVGDLEVLATTLAVA